MRIRALAKKILGRTVAPLCFAAVTCLLNSDVRAEGIEARLKRSIHAIFQLNDVKVEGGYFITPDEIRSISGLQPQLSLWDLSPREAERQLAKAPWFESVQISYRVFPARATVRVEEAEPWLIAESEPENLLISRSGRILQSVNSIRMPELVVRAAALPRVSGLPPQAGSEERFTQELRAVLEIIRGFDVGPGIPFVVERFVVVREPGEAASSTAISLRVEPLESHLFPPVLVRQFSVDDAKRAQIYFRKVVSDLRERGEGAGLIDLRFRNQAIIRNTSGQSEN